MEVSTHNMNELEQLDFYSRLVVYKLGLVVTSMPELEELNEPLKFLDEVFEQVKDLSFSLKRLSACISKGSDFNTD